MPANAERDIYLKRSGERSRCYLTLSSFSLFSLRDDKASLAGLLLILDLFLKSAQSAVTWQELVMLADKYV